MWILAELAVEFYADYAIYSNLYVLFLGNSPIRLCLYYAIL